jgi:hypothetical protein
MDIWRLLTNGEWANVDSILRQPSNEIFKRPDVRTNPGLHGRRHSKRLMNQRGVVIHVGLSYT